MLKRNNKYFDGITLVSGIFLLSVTLITQAADTREDKNVNQSASQTSPNNKTEIDLGASGYVSAYAKNAKALLGFDESGRQSAEMAFDVVDKHEERIGVLNDYLLTQNGEIKYAIVLVRDLPIQDDTMVKKMVAIPIDKIMLDEKSELSMAELQIVVGLTKEKVNQLPEFDITGSNGAQSEIKYDFSARELMGMKVIGESDALLGILDDLIISNNDLVSYAVIKASGVLGISDKLVAAPFKALQINSKDEKVRLNVTVQALEDAPGFQIRKPY
ncbi:MAG: hypothetical protein NMNS01_30130 [Nitrosomonas sp.]|nr:MAG: hypothetical protein NMNS01_30130 [Nitrosomonas sp.]